VITTAGDDPDRTSIGWEIHEYAMKVLSGEYIDPRWYVVVYNYDGDDIYNEENWFKANPSLGTAKSLDSMREAALTARNKPSDERLFRWLDLNQWITTKLTTWLPLDLYDKTVGDWSPIELAGRECYLGLDLSSTTDLSAISLVFPPQGEQLDWRVFWEAWIPKENMVERIRKDRVDYGKWAAEGWITPTDGSVIDYTKIRDRIVELSKLYKITEVVADPAFATMLLQELQQAGLTVVTVPQTYVNLTDPMNLTEVLLKEGKLTHTSSPVARWAFGNTSVARNGSGLIKFVKESKGASVIRTKRIDPMAAFITAMCRARFYAGSIDISSQILSDDWGM
jgi:phage terminase large subunit-like protein